VLQATACQELIACRIGCCGITAHVRTLLRMGNGLVCCGLLFGGMLWLTAACQATGKLPQGFEKPFF
jgi:hypothetical protein